MGQEVVAVVNRFPDRELEIHRLLARDPDFGVVCEEYSDGQAALRHWQAQGAAGTARVKEYLEMIAELEVEILDLLSKARRSD